MAGILQPNAIAATNIDSLNRSIVEAAELQNGYVVVMGAKSTTAGLSEVFEVSQPVAALSNLWMVYAGEDVVVTTSGNSKYKGLDPDPRNFVVPANTVVSAYKPQLGDIITVTADALTGTQSSNTFVVAANATYKLTWAGSAVSGLTYKLLKETYVSIADGSIGGIQRVDAFQFECVAIA
jgi:hypothetical protein